MARTRKKSQERRGPLRRIGGNGPWPVKVLRWLLFLGVIGLVTGTAAFATAYAVIKIPDPNADFQTQRTDVYFSDGTTKIGSFSTQDRVMLSYDEIPAVMKDAAIAAEDRTFWDNQGIDVRGIVRALRDNTQSGQITGGGSTITQQYVKILYLTQERTYTRKLKEAVLSVKIDNQLSKEEILEGYLNTIYFGNGAYGVEVAANNYFNKPASELTAPEAAYLATVINSPSYYDPYTEGATERILPRYNYVIDGMVKAGSLSAEEAAQYKDALPAFAPKQNQNNFEGPNGYLLELVQRHMEQLQFTDYEISGGGLKIVTTFDKSMQDAAIAAVNQVRPAGLEELNEALVSVEPGTGAVRAMYGGPDYLQKQFNWAVRGTQPGSTFKAFAVVAALENGYSLQTRLNGNSPLQIGNDTIVNQGDSGGQSYGYISLRQATANSVNTAFVDLTDQMEEGPQKILDAAGRAGIPQSTLDTINPVIGVSLGYENVAPVDMANGFATLAAGGKRAEWYVIESVTDSNGQPQHQHSPNVKQTIAPDVAGDTVDALQAVVQNGSGTRARTQCPTAGKTGTATATDANGDNERVSSSWFIGMTPKLVTAVMFNREPGNGQLRGYLNPFFGGTYPAQTFQAYQRQVIDPSDCGQFPDPGNIRAELGTVYTPPPPPPAPEPEPTAEPEPEPEPEPTPEPTTPPTQTTPPPTDDPDEPTTPPIVGGMG